MQFTDGNAVQRPLYTNKIFLRCDFGIVYYISCLWAYEHWALSTRSCYVQYTYGITARAIY